MSTANLPFNDEMECWKFYLLFLSCPAPHVPNIFEIPSVSRPQHVNKDRSPKQKMEFQKTQLRSNNTVCCNAEEVRNRNSPIFFQWLR